MNRLGESLVPWSLKWTFALSSQVFFFHSKPCRGALMYCCCLALAALNVSCLTVMPVYLSSKPQGEIAFHNLDVQLEIRKVYIPRECWKHPNPQAEPLQRKAWCLNFFHGEGRKVVLVPSCQETGVPKLILVPTVNVIQLSPWDINICITAYSLHSCGKTSQFLPKFKLENFSRSLIASFLLPFFFLKKKTSFYLTTSHLLNMNSILFWYCCIKSNLENCWGRQVLMND